MGQCECGCGQHVAVGKRFVNGHQNRGKNNPMFGKTHPPEIREKISEAGRQRIWSEDTKEKLRITSTGRRHTIAACAKMSDSHMGVPLSDEHRHAISAGCSNQSHEMRDKKSRAMMGHPVSTETRRKISEANTGENHGMYGIRGGNDMVKHHMIYDHGNLTKNIMTMTRSMHARLHQLFRKHGIEIPHINTTVAKSYC